MKKIIQNSLCLSVIYYLLCVLSMSAFGASLLTNNISQTIDSIKIEIDIPSKEAKKLKLTEEEIFSEVKKQFHTAGITILNEEKYKLHNKPARLKITITNIKVYEEVENNGYVNCSINKELFQYDRATNQIIISSYESSGISVGTKEAKGYIKNSIKKAIKKIIEKFCIVKTKET